MKIACISDLHGNLPKIEPCHIVIIAGDICPHFSSKYTNNQVHQECMQKNWLQSQFSDWLESLNCNWIVGIAGNHDFGLLDKTFAKSLPWNYLYNEVFNIAGLSFWGSPYTNKFFDWAFMTEEENLKNLWENIPNKLDFLITHGPPRGILDLSDNGYKNCGSKSLLLKVKQTQPKFHIFGHIHEGRGVMQNNTLFINASYIDKNYKMAYEPHYLEI